MESTSSENLITTPEAAGFFMPAEWEEHEAVWLAWPNDKELWGDALEATQKEFAALCAAIADVDPATKEVRGEQLKILVPDEKTQHDAKEALSGLSAAFFKIPFGDIWLRDTAPLFLANEDGEIAPVRFSFNGWGEKYVLKNDSEVSANISAAWKKESSSHSSQFVFKQILEGGSVDFDGEGTCLTTRQCLLNPNRNPKMDQEAVEYFLEESLGVEKTLWLGDGLRNDHTDGHIDTIARFSEPGTILCMKASGKDDPNAERYMQMQKELSQMTDAQGRKINVKLIPSPGLIVNENNDIVPASYLNFYIANTTVIVPIYGSKYDQEALAEIAKCFPERKTVGLMALSILGGGGAFHCITQQQPVAENN